MVIPFAAGNVTDSVARLIADRLGQAMGQPVVPDNKPGASGAIGSAALSRAAPDGYTIGMGSIGTMALNPALYSKLPYDPVSGFNILTVVYRGPVLILVDAASPWNTLKDLVQAAQQQSIDYASPGTGSSQHLIGELFRRASNTKLTHVPNKSSSQAATLLLGKHVPVLFEVTTAAMGYVKQKQVKALAVSSSQRVAALPDIPTVAESGFPGFSSEGWLCVMAPAGMPPALNQRLAAEVRRIMALPDMQTVITNLGAFPEAMTPEQSTAYVRGEAARWGELIRSSGIKLD
jgi:tripartite-type tricarboxylate transporter receptor subunit TctC